MRGRAILLTLLLLAVLGGPLAEGNASGKYNSTGGCSCHSGGSGQVTPSFSGLPSQYAPGQAYAITLNGAGGPSGSEGGFSLTVNKGSWSNLGSSVKSSGLSVTHSTDQRRSWTMTWNAPTAGSGTATFNVAVLYANGNGNNGGDGYGVRSVQVPEQPQANDPPTASNAQITPTSPDRSTGLSLSYNYADPNGDAESGTTIRWHGDGSHLSAHDDSTSVPGSALTKGTVWMARVTPSDGTDAGSPVDSNSVTVVNSAPSASNVLVSPAAPDETDVLTAAYAYSDLDSDVESGTLIRWYLDGAHVSELDDASSVSHLMTRPGDAWHFTVAVSDGEDTATSVQSNVVTIGSSNDPPTLSGLTISPAVATTADGLESAWNYADDTTSSADAVEIEWSRDGTHVPAHDGLSILPADATARGEVWTCRVRAHDGLSWSDWASSAAVVIQNSLPSSANVSVQPTVASSADDLTLAFTFLDADADVESGSSILWYRNGNLMTAYSGLTEVPASATSRGETWMARYTPNDGSGFGAQVQTDGVEILNSLATADVLSLPAAADSITPLVLNLSISDADGDDITTHIRWIRDGFQVGALDGATDVGVDWLSVGQMWGVEVQLDDGHALSDTLYSSVITLSNLAPTASFEPPMTILIEGETMLDASPSVDPEDELVAWFWQIGETVHSGRSVSVVLTDPTVMVNLTVIDAHGAQHSVIRTLNPVWGDTVTNLDATVEEGEVRLEWDWEGEATNFTVWRTHEAVHHSAGLAGLQPIATTGDSTWSEPIHLAGVYHYTVTLEIDGVHNPRVVTNTATVALSVDDMQPVAEAAAVESSGGGLLTAMLFLVLFATLAVAITDRFLGRDA